MKAINLNMKCMIGILIIIFWFVFTPFSFKQEMYDILQSFIHIPKNLSGILDMFVLLAVCMLCSFPFIVEKLSLSWLYRQLIGALSLLSMMLLCSLPFVNYTHVFQGNMSLFYFVIYQIIFVGLYEELLFRGMMVWVMRKFISSDILIALICPTVFAISHIGSDVFSLLQVVSAFAIGVIFTLLLLRLPRYFTIYSIGIVHGVFNVLVLGFSMYMNAM